MPTYCKDFKCTASKCKDNCCIGWEIDIDADTLAFYESVEGPFGEKLRKNIQKDEVSFFKLKGERCPFLNENNLCEIITNLGENHLCQICRDHPRYFNWYRDFIEGGVGLCCEEGARLILTNDDGLKFYETETYEDQGERYNKELLELLEAIRHKLIYLFIDRSYISLHTAASKSLIYTFHAEKKITDGFTDDFPEYPEHIKANPAARARVCEEIFSLFKALEPINGSWSETAGRLYENRGILQYSLQALQNDERILSYLGNIAMYFLWRYFLPCVYHGEIYSAVFLTVICLFGIASVMCLEKAAGTELTEEKCVEIAKDFSKQIEYSYENLSMIFDAAYNNEVLSPENFAGLFEG